MRKVIPILIVLGAAIAFLAAAPADKSKTYSVTADTIESCSCPLFCSCYFGPSADEHMCQANNVYKFRPGQPLRQRRPLQSDRLDRRSIWAASGTTSPGPGMPTEWAVLTFDKGTTKAQRDAIVKVVNTVFPVKWKHFSTREDTIEWHNDADEAAREAGQRPGRDLPRQDRDAAPGQEHARRGQEPPVLVLQLQRRIRPRHTGTHSFGGDAAANAPKFTYEKRNGFTIAWTAKGDIKPEKSGDEVEAASRARKGRASPALSFGRRRRRSDCAVST